MEEKWDDAVRAVKDLKTDAGKSIRAQALIGKNELDAAKALADEIIAGASPEPADLAVAYLTLGDVHFRKVRALTSDAEKIGALKDALVEYYRVDTQYSEASETAAKALFRAFQVCEQLSMFSAERRYASRKDRIKNMLLTKYGGSPEARRIAK